MASSMGRPRWALRFSVVPFCLRSYKNLLTLSGNILLIMIFFMSTGPVFLCSGIPPLNGFILFRKAKDSDPCLYVAAARPSCGRGHRGSYQNFRNKSRNLMEESNQTHVNLSLKIILESSHYLLYYSKQPRDLVTGTLGGRPEGIGVPAHF